MGPINNMPAFVQIMAWCRSGVKPLYEPMMPLFTTNMYIYIYVCRSASMDYTILGYCQLEPWEQISVKFESKDINFQRRKWICQYCQHEFCLNLNVFTHLPMEKMAADLADGIFKCIFLNENDGIWIQISLKFVPRSPIDKKPALVQVMNRRQAITWDNDDPPHWRIYASLGAEELTHCGLMTP